MQSLVEWEKYQFKKSQTILFPVVSSSRIVQKTGIVSVLVILVVMSHLWWAFLFTSHERSAEYYVAKVKLTDRLVISFLRKCFSTLLTKFAPCNLDSFWQWIYVTNFLELKNFFLKFYCFLLKIRAGNAYLLVDEVSLYRQPPVKPI
jgi:hypothetical protein